METVSLVLILMFLLSLHSQRPASASPCKCMPWHSCWPNPCTWQAFNSSIGGRLLSPKPWGWPCHPPEYDATACSAARRFWFNPYKRAANVGAMQSPNWEAGLNTTGCPLASNTLCYQGDVSTYAVNVSHVSHVRAAISFAKLHNLRLVIKSTGHDYLGRSTAAGSLSIWLHHLKTITLHDSFLPGGCMDVEPLHAVTAEPGASWTEVYDVVDSVNQVVVGPMGSSLSAAGGFVQGGGHSPMSRTFGFAADNVLEFKVVTADGALRVANRYQNRDLFWALSGGGGGTFGVVMSATYRTFPPLSGYAHSLYVAASADEDSQRSLIDKFIEVTPSMDRARLAGYFFIYTNALALIFVLPNGTVSQARAAFLPLVEYVEEHPRLVTLNYSVRAYGTFREWHSGSLCETYPETCTDTTGTAIRLASRMIPKELIQNSRELLTESFMEILYNRSFSPIFAVFVFGGEAASVEGRNNSLSRAWRDAVWEIHLARTWNESLSLEEQKELGLYVTRANDVLRSITPGGGCYKNEADYLEPDWQESFFSEKYSMLKSVKESVDPTGLLLCWKCVGSENWMEQCKS